MRIRKLSNQDFRGSSFSGVFCASENTGKERGTKNTGKELSVENK